MEIKKLSNKGGIFSAQLLSTIILLSIFLLFSSVAFANIPNSLTLQGKLTNTAGASQQGTYNFSFRIYDQATDGNILYGMNQSITTDANGVYDVILGNLNLSFADQYYLGITVSTDAESAPRVNLTSSPYSFRANVTESINPNASITVTNLSVAGNASIGSGGTILTISAQTFNLTKDGGIAAAGNITLSDKIMFRFGQVIDNLANGFLRISGNLNATGNASIAQTLFVDNTSSRVGIGTALPTDSLTIIGSSVTYGSLNGTYVNATYGLFTNLNGIANSSLLVVGNISNILKDQFLIGNLTGFFGSTEINKTIVRFNFSQQGNLTVNGLVNATRLNGSISCNMITDGSDGDFCADASGVSSVITNGSDAYFYYFNATNETINYSYIVNLGVIKLNGTDISLYNKSIELSPYQPISNVTALPFSNFQLSNVSNNTIPAGANVSIALWNTTIGNKTYYFTREANATVLIGSFNLTNGDMNLTELLNIRGNVSIRDDLVVGNNRDARIFNLSSSSGQLKIAGDFYANNIYLTGSLVQTEAPAFKRSNMTDFLGGADVNASLIKTGNLSTIFEAAFNKNNLTSTNITITNLSVVNINGTSLSLFNKSIELSPYQPISNVTALPFSNFQLSNVSNNTLVKGDNSTLALWNATLISPIINASYLYLREPSFNVVIGNVNTTWQNVTDKLLVVGSAVVFGSLNATFINATQILQSGAMVRTAGDFDLRNISNTTKVSNILDHNLLTKVADGFNKVNLTATNITITNLSIGENLVLGWTNLSNYPSACSAGQFVTQVGDTLTCAAVGSDVNITSPWNSTNARVYLNDSNAFVGIGTTAPLSLLHLNASDNNNGSLTNLITLDHNLVNPENSTNGIGIGLMFRISDNISINNASLINVSLVNAINTSVASAMSFYTRFNNGGLTPKLVLNGSDVFIAPTAGKVVIGGSSPTDTLTVIGSVSIFGSLNATRMNATNITSTGLYVDGGTLFVDSVNDRVGIGTTSSVETLSVAGNFSTTKTNVSIGNGNFTIGQFNSSCTGFRFGTTGGWILSCSP